MTDQTTPSATVTRKPDEVGTPGAAPVGGGHQTAEQAAITKAGGGGVSDSERDRSWRKMGGRPGRSPSPTGGASGGHADQKSAAGDVGKVAEGHYDVEKRGGSDVEV